ncbi:uncharacterized protein N7515_002445 [Penicillium bovifimosum]|uniref:Reverse transcriptase domain-containing protein n=1 Tax=Penicillium bovifimosum TaxID=126998 RepID=A0A9W9L990_9EURO|nr:uncharacterized protein N7515_002445 [Penicillium bovifimosum]KAJ5143658.1 hypothetical protein N7515_002445 [Penicillium bovifimosum]
MGEDAKPIFHEHEQRIGYADDLNTFKIAGTLEEPTRLAAEGVRRVTGWGARNKIVFAPEKFGIMHFSRRRGQDAPLSRDRGRSHYPPATGAGQRAGSG